MVKKTATAEHAAKKQAVAHTADRYIEAVGRRKSAIARIRISPGKGDAVVNDKSVDAYFLTRRLRETALAPLKALNLSGKYRVSAVLRGGGIAAQAEALRLGLSRALVIHEPDLKKRLRQLGFLTRDPRTVERKKYGLKKARRAPQWSKR